MIAVRNMTASHENRRAWLIEKAKKRRRALQQNTRIAGYDVEFLLGRAAQKAKIAKVEFGVTRTD